jgi:CheY-like chemotaxis protein
MAVSSFLLIDDDPDDLEIFSIALREASADADYIAVNDAERALKILRSGAVKFDVVFVDLNMPKIDGLDFLSMARDIESLKNVPVFLHTTSFSSQMRDKAIQLGASDLVTKHASMTELVAFLSQLMLR